MRYLTLIGLIAVLLVLEAGHAETCQTERPLQHGDRIRIAVLDEPDVTREAIIDKDGGVQLALLGNVKVFGLTTGEASALICKLLKDYIVEPNVTVELLEAGRVRVFVIGEVQKPGVYLLDQGAKIIEAVTLAGYTDKSDATKAAVHRGNEIISVDLTQFLTGKDLNANLCLESDDTIVVARQDLAHSVLVLGEVAKSGSTPFISGMTIKELIQACGGANANADISRITIRHSGSKEVRPVDFSSASSGCPQDIAILPGDIVFVPRAEYAYFIVEGGVNQPGKYCLVTGMTIEDALAAAGGVSRDAKLDSIQLVHSDCQKRYSQIVNLKQIRCGKSPMVCLQPRDVLVVPIKKSRPSAIEIICAIGAIGWIFTR